MRWKNDQAMKSREGEERTVRKFLLWPRSFGGVETRWLEYANIIECIARINIGDQCDEYRWIWMEDRFGPD
jgi:hypothetical protein